MNTNRFPEEGQRDRGQGICHAQGYLLDTQHTALNTARSKALVQQDVVPTTSPKKGRRYNIHQDLKNWI